MAAGFLTLRTDEFFANRRLFFARLKFEPIKHKDKGRYTCHVAKREDGKLRRLASSSITIAITKKIYKEARNTSKPLKAMNQKREKDVTPVKVEEIAVVETNASSNDVHHVVGFVGEEYTLSCPISSKFSSFRITQLQQGKIRKKFKNILTEAIFGIIMENKSRNNLRPKSVSCIAPNVI